MLKSWYCRHGSDRMDKGCGSNPWTPALKELQKPVTGPPKKLAAWQMFLNKNTERVNTVMKEEEDLPDHDGKKSIQLHSEIAQRLWEEEEEDSKKNILQAIEAEFQLAKETYDCLRTLDPCDPEVQKKYVSLLEHRCVPTHVKSVRVFG